MNVYLAVVEPSLEDDDLERLTGPWVDLRVVAGGALLIESDDTLSRVYHELAWSLPPGASVLVARVDAAKVRHQQAGVHTWLRDRLRRAPGG